MQRIVKKCHVNSAPDYQNADYAYILKSALLNFRRAINIKFYFKRKLYKLQKIESKWQKYFFTYQGY